MAAVNILSGGLFQGPPITAPDAITYAATITTDASVGTYWRVTLTGNLTLANPTGATDGQLLRWALIQDATGGRTLTLGNKFAFGTDITTAVLSTTANKRDFLHAQYDGVTDLFYVVGLLKGY